MKDMIKKILSMGIPIPKCVRPIVRLIYKLGILVSEGLVFLRKFFFVEPVLRSIAEVGKGLRVERLPYIRGKGKLVIGDNVNLSGQIGITFMNVDGDEPVIEIGDNTFMGHGCSISCARSVTIGKEVLVAAGVKIYDNDGHPHDAEKRRAGGKITEKEIDVVKINDGAWIGAGSTILKGVTIEENEIVGAGSVLRRKSENG
jgi:acetyltransferase-like isoleucine patch superfamily enzyme